MTLTIVLKRKTRSKFVYNVFDMENDFLTTKF